MTSDSVMQIEQAWTSVSRYLFVPHTEAQYDQLVVILDELLDNIGENETHPLASLMDVMGSLIEQYEDENVPKLSDIIDEITQRASTSED